MTTPNTELAYKVLDLTQKYRHHLDISEWVRGQDAVTLADLQTDSCGTTACFAGWTAAAAGYVVEEGGFVLGEDGAYRGPVWTVAAELLSISTEQADRLFHGTTDAGVPDAVTEIFGSRPDRQ